MTDNLILITLLVKLGVVAAVASVLARVSTFRRLFFAERRTPGQTLALLAFFLVPLTLGVWIRIEVPNFLAADISFATVILLGLLLGPGWAMLGGAVLAGPAVYHHEYLALPFNVALGLAAGFLVLVLTSFAPETDIVAHVGGFVFGVLLGGGLAAVRQKTLQDKSLNLACGVILMALLVLTWRLALGS